jgi:hypothetical protein
VCQIILLRFRKQACSCQAHSEGSFQFTVISGKGWHTHWYDILTNNSAFKQYFLMTFQTFLWFISHSHRTKKKGCLHVTRATLIMAGCVGISDHLCWDIPYMFINMFYILYIYVLYIHYKIYIYIYMYACSCISGVKHVQCDMFHPTRTGRLGKIYPGWRSPRPVDRWFESAVWLASHANQIPLLLAI